MRVFVSLFANADKARERTLLEIAAATLHFPPAVQAMHSLLRRKAPTPEDRAALSNSLFERYKTISDPTRAFELQFPRFIFGLLYDQVKFISEENSASNSTPDAIATQSLLCAITNKTVERTSSFASNTTGTLSVVDASITQLYRLGLLRKTITLTASPEGSVIERLSLYSGGRFEEITYFKSQVLGRFSGQHPEPDGNKESDPFAVVAPKDLGSVVPPALTRDESGAICVYLEKTKGLPPLKYFLKDLADNEHTSV